MSIQSSAHFWLCRYEDSCREYENSVHLARKELAGTEQEDRLGLILAQERCALEYRNGLLAKEANLLIRRLLIEVERLGLPRGIARCPTE